MSTVNFFNYFEESPGKCKIQAADEFANWLKPEYGIIKALIEL